tara:strand:+ start:661 stop:1386 length:726 start_codon:yes stop_codon:yes gene_type:complete
LEKRKEEKVISETDPKKGTGEKPKGSGRRLYTDENPDDTVPVKFRTVQDIKDTLSRSDFKSKSHARQSQIINLIHQRVRVAYQNAKDPDTKKRLKKAFDYAKKRKEASKKKTEKMRKESMNISENKLREIILEEIELHMLREGESIEEAEYKGRKVKLNDPFRTPDGPKKFSVYVKNEKGNVVKVNFGSKEMSIKGTRSPARLKSFRARHKCSTPGPKWKARYWACKTWPTRGTVKDVIDG